MGKFDFIIEKAEYLQKNIGKLVAPEINNLFVQSVDDSLVNYYNSYSPMMYKRTTNFFRVIDTARTTSKGSIITMRVDSSAMSDYTGFDIPPYPTYERETLSADTAFDFFFKNGEHGHGKWLMETSTPPFKLVDVDIQNGFNGKVEKIINNKIKEVFK